MFKCLGKLLVLSNRFRSWIIHFFPIATALAKVISWAILFRFWLSVTKSILTYKLWIIDRSFSLFNIWESVNLFNYWRLLSVNIVQHWTFIDLQLILHCLLLIYILHFSILYLTLFNSNQTNSRLNYIN